MIGTVIAFGDPESRSSTVRRTTPGDQVCQLHAHVVTGVDAGESGQPVARPGDLELLGDGRDSRRSEDGLLVVYDVDLSPGTPVVHGPAQCR